MHKEISTNGSHEYLVNGSKIPGVTRTLRDAGLVDFSFVPDDVMRRAQSFGKHLHKTIELYDEGRLDVKALDKNLIPYLDGWIKFKKDTEAMIEPDSAEKKVYSKKWNYAGTLDKIVRIRGRRTVIDFKSGPIYPSVGIQLAAYKEAENEGLPVKLKVKDREVVRLKDNGKYDLAPKKFFKDSDFRVFLACLRLNNWREIHGYKHRDN